MKTCIVYALIQSVVFDEQRTDDGHLSLAFKFLIANAFEK